MALASLVVGVRFGASKVLKTISGPLTHIWAHVNGSRRES